MSVFVKCADPACLARTGHEGPHMVPPNHPVLKGARLFVCPVPDCGYQFWDATFDDSNAHWLEHLREARASE